jgi:hypothetical protein
VSDDARDTACGLLTEALDAAYGVPREVRGIPTRTLVPDRLLTAAREGGKARNVFGPAEDWTRAIDSS